MDLLNISKQLTNELTVIQFSEPVHYVYNPLIYAFQPYEEYIQKYGNSPKEAVFFGMNPGPWGMVQTGIPFGTISFVRDWLRISKSPGKPDKIHPKRPVDGFDCQREEVSGKRIWGWAKQHFQKPESFFQRFFIANYCPLAFFDNSGRNITPDKLKRDDRINLFQCCNDALKETVEYLQPQYVIGIGKFVLQRITDTLRCKDYKIGSIIHPSPANPRANRDWESQIEVTLKDLGIQL